MQGPLHGVRGGLEAGDGQDLVEGEWLRSPGGQEVEVLPVHDPATHRIHDGQDGRQPARRQTGGMQHLLGPGEGQVADEDRRIDPQVVRIGVGSVAGGEGTVQGRSASPKGRTVHDVVVDQGEEVEQLQRRGGSSEGLRLALTAGRMPAQHTKLRPDPLAACGDEAPDVSRRARVFRSQRRTSLSVQKSPEDPVGRRTRPLQTQRRAMTRFGHVLPIGTCTRSRPGPRWEQRQGAHPIPARPPRSICALHAAGGPKTH